MRKPFRDKVYDRLRLYNDRLGLSFFDGPKNLEISPGDIPPSERERTPMHRAFYENQGAVVHKWRNYLDVYHRYFAPFRNTPVRFLEIGVSKGGSLQMWRQYFGDAAIIFGIDIDPECAKFDGIAGKVRIGSQDDRGFLEAVVREMGGVDIIIEDGSHIARHQRASFEALFPVLSMNGIYVCEDTHTTYWPGFYEGGYRRSGTFIEYAKTLVDDMHSEFHRHKPKNSLAEHINSIAFFNSMVVIEKSEQYPARHLHVPSPR